jgi:Flp pilus assembly protein TadB
MSNGTDVTYLAAFYYTASVLLVLTSVFAAINRSWIVAGACFILGMSLFSYRVRSSRKSG